MKRTICSQMALWAVFFLCLGATKASAQSNDPCALSNRYPNTICGWSSYHCGDRETFVYTEPNKSLGYRILQWTITHPGGAVDSFPGVELNPLTYDFPDVVGTYVIGVEVEEFDREETTVGNFVRDPQDTLYQSHTTNVVARALPTPTISEKPDQVCPGTPARVEVAAQANATSYRWIAPVGWTWNNSGQRILTTAQNFADLNAPSSGNGFATFQVRANNYQDACYSSSSNRNFSLPYGSQNHSIIGATTVNPNEGRYYYIDDSGVDQVTWQVPIGWSLQGTQSGQGTLGANVFTGAFSGNIRATYVSCGVTKVRTLAVTVVSGPVLDPGFGKAGNPVALDIYPNPSRGDLTLEAPKAVQQLRVRNMLGQVVEEVDASGKVFRLDLSHLEPGLYLIDAEMSGQRIQQKVLLMD